MQFVEAFEHLGYNVEAPRQDWSAEKEDGICISLWKKEMGTRDRPLISTSSLPILSSIDRKSLASFGLGGRPAGFPDWPFLKRCFFGGFP